MRIKTLEIIIGVIGVGVALLLLGFTLLDSKVKDCQAELLYLRQGLSEKDSNISYLQGQMNYYVGLNLDQLIKNRTEQAKKFFQDSQNIWEELLPQKASRDILSNQVDKKRKSCDKLSVWLPYISLFILVGYLTLFYLFIQILKKIRKK